MTPAQIRRILRISEGSDLFVNGVGLCFHLDGEIKVSPYANDERRTPNDIDRGCFWVDRAELRARLNRSP